VRNLHVTNESPEVLQGAAGFTCMPRGERKGKRKGKCGPRLAPFVEGGERGEGKTPFSFRKRGTRFRESIYKGGFSSFKGLLRRKGGGRPFTVRKNETWNILLP